MYSKNLLFKFECVGGWVLCVGECVCGVCVCWYVCVWVGLVCVCVKELLQWQQQDVRKSQPYVLPVQRGIRRHRSPVPVYDIVNLTPERLRWRMKESQMTLRAPT